MMPNMKVELMLGPVESAVGFRGSPSSAFGKYNFKLHDCEAAKAIVVIWIAAGLLNRYLNLGRFPTRRCGRNITRNPANRGFHFLALYKLRRVAKHDLIFGFKLSQIEVQVS